MTVTQPISTCIILRARLFRRLPCTERQFRKSPFQDCVWLGDICGIAFSIPQIFAIPKMKFSTAFSASRGWNDWVAANCFARFRKFFTEILAYPFSIYIYLITLGSLRNYCSVALSDWRHCTERFPGKHSHI